MQFKVGDIRFFYNFQVEFPAVTVCNQNRVNCDNLLGIMCQCLNVTYGCDKDIQWLLIPLVLIIDLGPILGPVAPDRDPAPRLFFEFLLSLPPRPNYLPNVVQRGVIWLRDVDFL